MTYNCCGPNLQASIIKRDVPLDAIIDGGVCMKTPDFSMVCTIPLRVFFLELLDNGLYLIIKTELKHSGQ